MKQIAVEWLVDQIAENLGIRLKNSSIGVSLLEQAKVMEKEKAIKFGKIVADKWGMIPVPLENIEDTYNETFKSE